MIIRKDEKSLYVVHGDDKIRPLAMPNNPQFLAEEYRKHIEEYIGKKITVNGSYSFKEGDKVNKYHHSGTLTVTISSLNGMTKELWFIEEGDSNGY